MSSKRNPALRAVSGSIRSRAESLGHAGCSDVMSEGEVHEIPNRGVIVGCPSTGVAKRRRGRNRVHLAKLVS